ncbi:DUF2946 family protein [Azospirillum endophyticum]
MAGMAALLLQVIAWGWLTPVTGTAKAGETAVLLICSSGGLTTIEADAADYGIVDPGSAHNADGQGKPSDSPHPGTGHCPLCPLVAGLALPPPPLTVDPAVAMARDTRLLPAERLATGWFLSTLQARAPPSLA